MGGFGGPDIMLGEGDDRLRGGNGGDVIWGNSGNDVVSGGQDATRPAAGAGDDIVDGRRRSGPALRGSWPGRRVRRARA